MQNQSLSTYSVFGTENVSLKCKESLNPSESANPHIDPAHKCYATISIDQRKEGGGTARIDEAKRGARALFLKSVACRMRQGKYLHNLRFSSTSGRLEDQVLPILAAASVALTRVSVCITYSARIHF